jgi:hypothetical protein
VLVISGGSIQERAELPDVATIASWPARPSRSSHDRRACFDASVYDRLRVLTTELNRVRDEGGQVSLRIGHHLFPPDRVTRLMATI